MSVKPWTSSYIMLRETRFEGYLTNIEPLRVGAGREAPLSSLVDLAVIRIPYKGMEVPYIPGSSLKGVFRSWATAIVKSRGEKACSGLVADTCMDALTEWEGEVMELRRWVERLIKEGKSEEAMRMFFNNACILCKVFGAPGYIGKARFSDAYPIDYNGNIIPFSFGSRTGIAIDRRTGAVSRRALYTVEFVEPGAKFKFAINCLNLPNYALGLLSSILRMMNEGYVKIGGFKTRGFGSVKLENLRFSSRDLDQVRKPYMRSLEPDKDRDVDLSGIARFEGGWVLAEGKSAWAALRKLEEVWEDIHKS